MRPLAADAFGQRLRHHHLDLAAVDPRTFALVWVKELMDEQKAIFGPDPWPYNLDDNRKALEAAIRYEYEQGMIKKAPSAEELFFPPSLQRIQHYV